MSETKQKNTAKKSTKSKSKTQNPAPGLLSRAVHSERFPKVMGVCLGVFTVFCFVCFVSFFWSWAEDYTKMQSISPIKLLVGEQDIQNWGGPLGAFLSYVFIRHTFGIASFGFLILSALLVLRLFKVDKAKLSQWTMCVLVIMLWLSVVFGFCVEVAGVEFLDVFAGTVGMAINYWLVGVIGKLGATLFLIAFTIVFPMILFNVRYGFVLSFFAKMNANIKQRKERRQALTDAMKQNQIEQEELEEKQQEAETPKETPTLHFSTISSVEESSPRRNPLGDLLSKEEEKELTTFTFTDTTDRRGEEQQQRQRSRTLGK